MEEHASDQHSHDGTNDDAGVRGEPDERGQGREGESARAHSHGQEEEQVEGGPLAVEEPVKNGEAREKGCEANAAGPWEKD
jgi:hypothetical protein